MGGILRRIRVRRFRRQAKSYRNGILRKIMTGLGEMPGVIDEHLSKLSGE